MNKEMLVCQKHNKKESNLALVLNQYCVCLNKYCPDSFKMLCSACRPSHRDHATKMMSL